MHHSLTGRRALVTGSTSGLGEAIAIALAEVGAEVVLHYRGTLPSEELLTQIEGLTGVVPNAFEADISKAEDVEALFEQLDEAGLTPNILVNNAGILIQSPFTEMQQDVWQRTIDINLTGTYLCSKAAVARMLPAGGGVIVNVASQLAFKGAKETAAYSASKGGMVSLTRAMARELGPEIRVNAIAPGPIWTPMNDEYADDQWIRERTQNAVIQELARPEQVARSVVFLASDAGELMQGQALHVNGGGVMA